MVTRRGIAHSIYLIATVATALSLGPACAAAAEDTSEEAGPPRVEAVVVDLPPVLDGVLDDGCWEQATHIEGFWRQTTDAPEFERTEAWICCDDTAIHVAFRCHDTNPDEIRRARGRHESEAAPSPYPGRAYCATRDGVKWRRLIRDVGQHRSA